MMLGRLGAWGLRWPRDATQLWRMDEVWSTVLDPILVVGGESVEDYAVLDDKQSNKVLLSVHVLDMTRFSKWMYV